MCYSLLMKKLLCPHLIRLTQMVPLIKRSTDTLVEVIGEKAAAEVTFDAMEYVYYNHRNIATIIILNNYRVYSRFTLEAIVATAFGRQVNLQRGESDEFSKAMDSVAKVFFAGGFEYFILIHSMLQ